jgi:hypothetical protein
MLRERVRFFARNSLLMIDEIGRLPVGINRANLCFRISFKVGQFRIAVDTSKRCTSCRRC